MTVKKLQSARRSGIVIFDDEVSAKKFAFVGIAVDRKSTMVTHTLHDWKKESGSSPANAQFAPIPGKDGMYLIKPITALTIKHFWEQHKNAELPTELRTALERAANPAKSLDTIEKIEDVSPGADKGRKKTR